jgi:hypothetical protein
MNYPESIHGYALVNLHTKRVTLSTLYQIVYEDALKIEGSCGVFKFPGLKPLNTWCNVSEIEVVEMQQILLEFLEGEKS